MSILNVKHDLQICVPFLFFCQILNVILLLFRHPSPSVLIPALRTVGNIVTGDDMQTQVLRSIISHNSLFSIYVQYVT